MASTTFPVQSVEPSQRRFKPVPSTKFTSDWAKHGRHLEAHSPLPKNSVFTFDNHPLAVSVQKAFYGHFPLILSPDAVWFTIAQGLANHVNANAEKLRSRIVAHEGKEEIQVIRPEFIKGDPNNDWESVFPEFAEQIGRRTVNNIADLIVADFSTTTKISRICSQITLMSTVQHYFDYVVRTLSGIPSITLTGTIDDWKKIRERAARLGIYDLSWWTKELLPVLDQFVSAAEGKPNRKFFQSMVNVHGESGSPYQPLTGWITSLFPYLSNGKKASVRNESLGIWRDAYQRDAAAKDVSVTPEYGLPIDKIPSGLSAAPFIFKDDLAGKQYSMALMGGLVSVCQDPKSGALEAQFGWAVIEK